MSNHLRSLHIRAKDLDFIKTVLIPNIAKQYPQLENKVSISHAVTILLKAYRGELPLK